METTKAITKTKWNVDRSHSEISFKVKHLMMTYVSGTFREFDGNIYTSGDNFKTAEVDFWINPSSVNTGDEKRDTHIKSADFFDVEKFKKITFVANTLEHAGKDDKYELSGDLTIKDITRSVKLNVEFGGVAKDPWGNTKAGFSISGKINRKDFGLTWNAALETGGVLVSDEVTISCELQLIKSSAK